MHFKKITKYPIIRRLLGLIISLYVKVVYKTGNWQVIYPQSVDIAEYFGKSAIYAFWHGRLAMMPYLNPHGRPMNVLISSHSDGDIIGHAMSGFGSSVIYGSSKKNSSQALRQIIRKLRSGENIAITPDGSRGPRMQINSNIIDVARITNTAIIPISFSIKDCHVFRSWDRFMMPIPFSKGILIYGKPIIVPQDATEVVIDSLKQLLQDELNAITIYADQRFGHNIP